MQFFSWICFLWLALCPVFDFSMSFLPSSHAISYLLLLLKVGSCLQICMLFPRTQREGVWAGGRGEPLLDSTQLWLDDLGFTFPS